MEVTENTGKTERCEKEDAKHGKVSMLTHHLEEFFNYQFVLVVVIFEGRIKKRTNKQTTAVMEIMIA